MTVVVTPHSADSYGLAVTKKMAEGFYVKELASGKGNFSFDWEVKAQRNDAFKPQVMPKKALHLAAND
jgi:hypothetical protein